MARVVALLAALALLPRGYAVELNPWMVPVRLYRSGAGVVSIDMCELDWDGACERPRTCDLLWFGWVYATDAATDAAAAAARVQRTRAIRRQCR